MLRPTCMLRPNCTAPGKPHAIPILDKPTCYAVFAPLKTAYITQSKITFT